MPRSPIWPSPTAPSALNCRNINSAEVDGNTITIAFDRELATTTPNTGTFRVTANGKAIKVTAIKLNPANREALLTSNHPLPLVIRCPLLHRCARQPKEQRDRGRRWQRSGDDLRTEVTNNTRKSTSDLKVDYADADGSTINLYLTDALSSSIPKASRFSVTANKRKQKIGSISTDPDEGIVSLNLRKAISSEQDILINYRDLNGDQRSGVIEDRDGNDLASFSKLSVQRLDQQRQSTNTGRRLSRWQRAGLGIR